VLVLECRVRFRISVGAIIRVIVSNKPRSSHRVGVKVSVRVMIRVIVRSSVRLG
jgi:hypothetical protein